MFLLTYFQSKEDDYEKTNALIKKIETNGHFDIFCHALKKTGKGSEVMSLLSNESKYILKSFI